jgi:hypothetical protein
MSWVNFFSAIGGVAVLVVLVVGVFVGLKNGGL